jgi:hypothetical protein
VCDIALHGSDLFRIGVFYGDVLMEHVKFPKSGGKQIIEVIKGLQAKHVIRAAHVLYDADGVGGFIGQKGGFIPGAVPFHGNASPLKKKNRPHRKAAPISQYANLKSQGGYRLAEKINEGQLWAKAVADENDREMLSDELAQIKKDKEATDNKLRLRRKELVVQDLGRSPDFADLFLMLMYFDLNEQLQTAAKQRPIA